MFREMTRKHKQISSEACVALLKSENRGVLSVLGDGDYPYGMPMNHFYNEADGCIYFHCGKQKSHRLDSIKRHDKASFCVFDQGWREEGEWALHVNSVIVFGHVEIIDDYDTVIEISKQLCYKFTQDEQYIQQEIQRSGKGTRLLRLVPEHMTGKAILES